MKKIIIIIRNKLLNFSDVFEMYTLKIWFKIRVKYKFVWNKTKINKDYKKEIKNYWFKYKKISTNYHKMYSDANGIEDVRYIPDYIYACYIIPYFNKLKLSDAIEDKNYYDSLFTDVNMPKSIVKNIDNIFYDSNFNIIDKNKAINIIKDRLEKENLLVKPTIYTCGGENIIIIKKNANVEEIFEKYKSDYIFQSLIKQSAELSKIHKESVNTIRTMSLLYNNQVIILSSILRVGVGESYVDNASVGGIVCGISNDGFLKKDAYDIKGNKFLKHPTTGIVFEDYPIVGYDKVIEKIKKLHLKLAHFKLISWDFTINENHEPVLIEVNLKQGGIEVHQFTNGPLFGNLTDQILSDIFLNIKK